MAKEYEWGNDEPIKQQEEPVSSRSLFDNLGDAISAIGANFDVVRGSNRVGDLMESLKNPERHTTEEDYYQNLDKLKQEYIQRELAQARYQDAQDRLVADDSFLKNLTQMGGTLEGMAAQALGTAGGAVLGGIATGGAGIGAGAKLGNTAGAIAGAYLDARSVALEAREKVLEEGGTWEQAQQAYEEALKKASLTTLPETAVDIAMGNRLVRSALGSKAARNIAGSAIGRAGASVLDPAARLGTKAAFASGKGLVGRGVGLATDIALQGATEAGQEVTQDYIANREVAKALGQQDNEYSLGGFKDYALSDQGLETMKTAGIMGALFGGAGGVLSSGQYLQRGAETNRGIQTRNATEKMIQNGSLEIGEDQRQKLEKFISDEKGNSPAELASWSDSEIIAEASILDGRKQALDNKTGEKESLSTIRGAVNVINRISGNESTNISMDDLTPQAKEYLDIIGVADDMRQQMFKPISKALVVAKLSGNTINSMKQNEGKTIQEVVQDEKTKQIPNRQVPLLGRPNPNFTMGEGTAARYTGNPNFVMYNNENPNVNADNIQNATNREVIDMARQTQNDSPYGSTRQSISEEMTRRGLNLGDENREVGQYTGEPYSGSRDISTMIDGKVMNDTTAEIFADKLLETHGDNVNAMKELLRKFYKQAKDDKERAWITKIGHIAGQRYQAQKFGTAYNENGTYYAGQSQPNNNFGYAGTEQNQSTDVVQYNGGGGARFSNNNELKATPLPLNAMQFSNGNDLGNAVEKTSFVQNLTLPAENGTVEKNEGGQVNGQTENTRRGEDLSRVNEQQRPNGRDVRQESLQGRKDEENVAGRQKESGNSEQGVLKTFGRQILGRIPQALKKAWKGLGCNSNIDDWRIVANNKEFTKLFSDALAKSIKSNVKHGVYVSPMSVEELNGATIVLHKSKKAGLAIKDGTLHGVFKDPSLAIPKVIRDITLIARELGCVRMDCYGDFLVQGYQTLGYVPVAKLTFTDAYIQDEIKANPEAYKTILKEKPPVYVLVRNNDSNEVARNKIANKEYGYMTDEELDSLPTFDDYDGAISYGDSAEQIKQKVGDKYSNYAVVSGTEYAREYFDEIKGEPKSVLDQVLKDINKKLRATTDAYAYSYLVELKKNLQNAENSNNQKLSKQEVSSRVERINKQIDKEVRPELEEYSAEDIEHSKRLEKTAKEIVKMDEAAKKQQQQQKQKTEQKKTEEKQTPITKTEYVGKLSDLTEEETNELEQQAEKELSTKTETEERNSSGQIIPHPFKSKKEARDYLRKKLKEKFPQGEQKKQTAQQKPTKQKTESDNVVDGWIERLTSDGEFDFNDASIKLYELLDKGSITEKEYNKIMNGLMEYAENQEEVSSKEQEEVKTDNKKEQEEQSPYTNKDGNVTVHAMKEAIDRDKEMDEYFAERDRIEKSLDFSIMVGQGKLGNLENFMSLEDIDTIRGDLIESCMDNRDRTITREDIEDLINDVYQDQIDRYTEADEMIPENKDIHAEIRKDYKKKQDAARKLLEKIPQNGKLKLLTVGEESSNNIIDINSNRKNESTDIGKIVNDIYNDESLDEDQMFDKLHELKYNGELTGREHKNAVYELAKKVQYEKFLSYLEDDGFDSYDEFADYIDNGQYGYAVEFTDKEKSELKQTAEKHFKEKEEREQKEAEEKQKKKQNGEEHYWDKYRSKDGIIENEKEGVYQDGRVDEPLFADWKDEDEVPTDGQDYIYILCGNYDVSNKLLANLKARIKKEMNSKHPRGDVEFLNDAYDEITEEQNGRAENDERISVEDNTCPWTSEMIFDNMLEQAQFVESQNEESLSNSEFLKQSKPKEKSTNAIYESLTEQEKKKVDSVNNVDGIKNLSEHGKIVFFEALQRFKQAKSKLVSKLDVENAIVFARMCERIASLYNREANLGKTYNAKMVADQITIELDVINNEDSDYGESGIIWDGETPTLKSVTDRIIRIFSKPSPTTFIHEATHIYDWELELIAKESPNGQAAKDLQALRKWARYTGKERELNNIKNITSGQQQVYIDLIDDIENAKSEDERKNALRKWEKEKVARGFEEYLRTKQAPVSGLNNVFKRFKNWIASFWNDMRGLSVTPSKEVQEVFDRMILTDQELRKKYGNFKTLEGDNQNGRRVVEGTNTRNEETLQHKEGSRRSNEGNTGLNGTRELDQGGTQGTRSNTETKSNDRKNRKRGTKNKTLTDEQIEAMDKREEAEYNKRKERVENADAVGELSDVVKDVYSVTFTKSSQEFAENRTRMEYFDNRDKYWNRSEKDGNVTYTRKTPFEHHQKEVTYDGANGFTKEDKKKTKPAQWLEWAKDQIIKYAFNDMHFLAKAARKLGKYDAYVKMIVTKGYALKANTAMQRGIKYNGKYTRALNDIIKEIGEEKQKDFIEYCIAKRVIDLSKRDIPVYQDMKPDEAADLIKKYESGADAKLFMKNQKDFVEYNKALLHVLVDGGIHTEEEFQKLIEVDPNFVPLSKVMDDADMGFNSIQAARSIVNVKTPLKRIGTSFRKVKNPFLEMQKRTAEYYAIASRNKAGQIFVNEIANALDKKANGDTIAKGQGMIRQVSVDEKDGNLITKPDDKQQIIYVCNNGKHEFYQVSDPEIYRALKALDADQMGTIQKMIDPFLHAPSALIRETATMVPDFGVRNLLRDGGEAFLTSEHGFLPFIDQIWGMYQMANNTEWYQRFLEQKGEYGTYNRENANDGVARIEDTIDEKVNPIKNFNEIRNAALQKLTNKKNSKATRAVALLQLMGSMPYAVIKSNKRLNDYLEMGTRVGEFKNAKMGYNGTLDRLSRGGILDWNADINKARQDDVLAAGAAKEITLNFEQYGIIGKQLNRYIPFFNATLQGIYKMCNALELMATGTTLSGQKNRTLQGELLFKAALITAIGVGVAAAGEGDDDYEEANQYEKENFWILPNGLRFPKDQVLGKLFGNVAEKSYTQWRKGKFEPSDILRSIKENFTPDKFIPALAEIALGGMYNYDTFYKSAIVPEYMQGKLGHLQKDLATSNMASDVSDFLWKYTRTDVSAKRLDWALQKNLTNCKKYIDAIYDLGKKAYDPKSFNEKMARGYDKGDSTGAFVGGLKDDIPKPLSLITGTFATNRTNYKSISDFYERYNDLKKLATDEGSMSKEDKRAWKRYEQAYKKDKVFRKELRAIKSDKSLTGKQKREKADKIFKQQIKLAKWAEG